MHWKLLLAASCLALGTLACSSAQPPAQTTPSDQPKQGGTFHVSVTDDPFDYDMSLTGSSNTNPYIIKLSYNSLMRKKVGPDIGYGQSVIEPALVESWEVSPDAKSYTFHLRKDLKFANIPPVNGRALTSADVKFSYEYMARTGAYSNIPAGQFTYLFEGMQPIETPDANTVIVKFKDGFAPFLNYAGSSDNVIMPKEIFDADGNFKNRIAGSGPFQLDVAASQKGSSWIMKRNPTYFEPGRPYVNEVKFLIIVDDATRRAAFQSKQIDYITTTDFRIADEIKKVAPNAAEQVFTTSPYRLDLNFKRPPLGDLRVRKAVSMALDRDEMVKVLQGGRGGWALASSNIRSDLFTQDQVKSVIKYDPEGAKKLLTEAGFANGFKVELLSGETETATKPAQLIQAYLKKVGIDATLKPVNSTESATRRRARDLDILFLTEAQYSDLDGSLHLMVSPTGAFNYGSVDDPKINELLAAQRREVNPEKRNDLLRQLIRYENETATLIPTIWMNLYVYTQPHVRDFYQNADYRSQGIIDRVWLAN